MLAVDYGFDSEALLNRAAESGRDYGYGGRTLLVLDQAPNNIFFSIDIYLSYSLEF